MVKPKRGLGKGLGALIPEDVQDVSRETTDVKSINIDMIRPNKEQPRSYFDEESIENLTESILEHGVIQPIIVKKLANGYEIVAGERRWRASKKAKLNEIPVIIKNLDDVKLVQIALIENLQREDLNAIEEAIAYKSLMNDYDFTQDRVSKVVGKSRSHIANMVRLLGLSDKVQALVAENKLTAGHGKSLAVIQNNDLQIALAIRVIDEELSVRDIEKIISNLTFNKNENETFKKSKEPSAVYAENILKDHFDTKVSVKMGKRKGKIEIEFYGEKDLSRLIEMIKYH